MYRQTDLINHLCRNSTLTTREAKHLGRAMYGEWTATSESTTH